MAKGKGTITVEVNELSMRVCEVKPYRAGKPVDLGGRFTAALPSGLVSDGYIKEPAKLGELLSGALASHGMAPRGVIFSVFSNRIAVKEAVFPPLPARKIGEVVLANVHDYFPVDLKDYTIGYTVGEAVVGDPDGKTRVFLCAAPTAMLDRYSEVAAAAAGLRVESVDFAANSKTQLYRALKVDGASIFADVDVDVTYLTFMSGGVSLVQRTLPFGGGALIGDYMAATGEDLKQAFAALSDPQRAEDLAGVLGEDALSDFYERVSTGIRRAVNVYEGQHSGTPVERIALCGAAARFVGLREGLEHLGMPVHIIDELQQTAALFPQVGEGRDFVYMGTAAAAFAPIGLKTGDTEKDERKRKRAEARLKADNSMNAGIAVALLFLLVGGALCLTAWSDYRDALKTRDETIEKIDGLQFAQDAYDEFLTYRGTAMSFARLADNIDRAANENIRGFFEELEAKMPAEILLLSAGFTESGVTLNATTASKEGAARVIETLRGFESLKAFAVSVSSISETETMAGARYSFSISCGYADYKPQQADDSGETIADDIEALNNFRYRQRRYDFEGGGGQ